MSAVETPGTIAFLEENLVSLYSINLLSADVPLLEQNVNNNKTIFFTVFELSPPYHLLIQTALDFQTVTTQGVLIHFSFADELLKAFMFHVGANLVA